MPDSIEVELINGARAWPETQDAFGGVIASNNINAEVEASWYDTDLDDNEGAFALVKTGTPLEDLVGDILRVDYGDRTAYVYVAGSANSLPTDFSLARRAFMALEVLSETTIRVTLNTVIAP